MTGVFIPCECISFKKYFYFYFSTFHCVKTLTIQKLGRRKDFKMGKKWYTLALISLSTAQLEMNSPFNNIIRWFVCSCVYVLVCHLCRTWSSNFRCHAAMFQWFAHNFLFSMCSVTLEKKNTPGYPFWHSPTCSLFRLAGIWRDQPWMENFAGEEKEDKR